MKRAIKMVQFGCGKMSLYTMRYALEKGVKIVGAFDIDENKVGKDINSLLGGPLKKVKILHASKLDDFLSKHEVDVVVVTTMSLLNDVKDVLLTCAKNGVNAITTCEEAFYPQNSNPKLTASIDKLAKQNDCTICGSGYQDVFWGNLITAIAGATHKIKKIQGKSSYNVEDYGIALAEVHGAGLTTAQFEKQVAAADKISAQARETLIKKGEFAPCYMWNVNGWLASRLGLTVVSQTQKCVPQIAKNRLTSTTLGMDIPRGRCTGMSAVVTTKTKEGVDIITECIGKVYDKTEFDQNDWTIFGEPNTQVTINRPSTVELTCATVINRLPDVINAPSGYYTTEKMPTNEYRAKSLESYVKE